MVNNYCNRNFFFYLFNVTNGISNVQLDHQQMKERRAPPPRFTGKDYYEAVKKQHSEGNSSTAAEGEEYTDYKFLNTTDVVSLYNRE